MPPELRSSGHAAGLSQPRRLAEGTGRLLQKLLRPRSRLVPEPTIAAKKKNQPGTLTERCSIRASWRGSTKTEKPPAGNGVSKRSAMTRAGTPLNDLSHPDPPASRGSRFAWARRPNRSGISEDCVAGEHVAPACPVRQARPAEALQRPRARSVARRERRTAARRSAGRVTVIAHVQVHPSVRRPVRSDTFVALEAHEDIAVRMRRAPRATATRCGPTHCRCARSSPSRMDGRPAHEPAHDRGEAGRSTSTRPGCSPCPRTGRSRAVILRAVPGLPGQHRDHGPRRRDGRVRVLERGVHT